MKEYVIQLIAVFIGTIGFSIFFNIKKERLFYVAILGTATCGLYFLSMEMTGDDLFLSNFIACAAATVVAELSARWKKAPSIVFLLPSIIPLIPGGSFYYTMSCLVNGDEQGFGRLGTQTMQSSLGIAIGILVASVFFYRFAKPVQSGFAKRKK